MHVPWLGLWTQSGGEGLGLNHIESKFVDVLCYFYENWS